MPASPYTLSRYTVTTCLGQGLAAHLDALTQGRSGLTPCRFETVDLPTWIGEVAGVDTVTLPAALARFDCRNNRLAWLALQADGFLEAAQAAIARHGAERVGLFLGTSTSGILQTEQAYRQRDPATGALPGWLDYRTTHNTFSVGAFVQQLLGLQGPAGVISTACSSSAKVFATAQRLLQTGMIDAAIVGGVDSLCLTTLYGFSSLELTSPEPCRPYDANRRGISIGEGAAFILLERPDATGQGDDVQLLGVGESSDAWHMSAPHPEGRGAQAAMQAALSAAGLTARDLDYINLHGTATPSNDAAEGHAVLNRLGNTIPCSSTKGATGHTLGAAGAVEAVFAALAIRHGFLPGSVQTQTPDPALPLNYLLATRPAPVRHVLSNSFGFGGSNCSLILGRQA